MSSIKDTFTFLTKEEAASIDSDVNANKAKILACNIGEHLEKFCGNITVAENENTIEIVFKYEGLWYEIILHHVDPTYVRLRLPNFLKLDNSKENLVARVVEALNYTAGECKCGKVTITGDDFAATAACEFLVEGENISEQTIRRYLNFTFNTAKTFDAQFE